MLVDVAIDLADDVAPTRIFLNGDVASLDGDVWHNQIVTYGTTKS